jgi:4-amino-4-deoxy-L-arabinose transferase-like glycosyltransferase
MQRSRWGRDLVLVTAIWTAFAVLDLAWVALDAQPAGCDQAGHLMRSLSFSEALVEASPSAIAREWRAVIGDVGQYTYPPLFHLAVAALLTAGIAPAVATVLANLAFLWILLWSVLQIGTEAFGRHAGIVAAILVAALPQMAQFRHEAFLDFALASTVSWSLWMLLGTRGPRRPSRFILAGLATGAALLVKPVAVVFLAAPAVFLLWPRGSRRPWKAVASACLWIGSAALIAWPWYGVHLREVLGTGAFNQHIAAVEGDPMPWTVRGALFYPHAMASLQLGFPIFVLSLLAVAGWMLHRWYRGAAAPGSARAQGLVLSWLAGGLVLLTFVILNKDVRYSIPLLPAVSLLICAPASFLRRPRLRLSYLAVVLALALPYYTHMMWNVPALHHQVEFRTGGLTWTVWNRSYYYGSAPRREGWGISALLDQLARENPEAALEEPIQVALVPFLLRLNPNSIGLEARLRRIPVQLTPVGSQAREATLEEMLVFDYLLDKTGDLGLPFETGRAGSIRVLVEAHPDTFEPVASFSLPGPSTGRLYRIRPAP